MTRRLIWVTILWTGIPAAAADELNVLTAETSDGGGRMMHVYLQGLAHVALDRRAAAYEKIKTGSRSQVFRQILARDEASVR